MYESLGPYYDLVHRDFNARYTGETLAFLHWAWDTLAARRVEDVLDAGAGTGRLALPLAEEGYRVTALDRSAAMLEQLRGKALERETSLMVEESRLESLDVSGAFDAIVCAFTTFQHLVDEGEPSATLERLFAALRPGGLLVFDVCNGLRIAELSPENTAHHEDDDIRILRHVQRRVDDVACLLWFEELTLVEQGGKTHSYTEVVPMRLYTAREVLALLDAANFVEPQVFRGYNDRGDLTGNSDWLVFCGVRP